MSVFTAWPNVRLDIQRFLFCRFSFFFFCVWTVHRELPALHVSQWDILALTFTVQESTVSGSCRIQSCGIQQACAWWEGGGGHTASWVFCRVEPEPMPGTDRTNQGRAQASSMHANQPVRGARVEGNCRGSLPWIQQQQQQSHSITWAGKPGGRNVVSWRRRHEAQWPSVTSLLLRTVKGWSKRIDTFFFLGG